MISLPDNAQDNNNLAPKKLGSSTYIIRQGVTQTYNTLCSDNIIGGPFLEYLLTKKTIVAPDDIVSQVFSRGFIMSCKDNGKPSWPRSWKQPKQGESLDNEGYLANLRGLMRQEELDKYIALVPREGYIVVDCDDQKTAETVLTYIEDNDLNPLIMNTDRGAHYTFVESPYSGTCKNTANIETALGVYVDYRQGGASQGLVFARKGKVEVNGALVSGAPREFYVLQPDKDISPFPELLAPVSAAPAAGTCSVMASTGPVLEQAKPAPGEAAAPAPARCRGKEYFDKTLKELCQEVEVKGKGGRNHTLNRCALRAYRVALATDGDTSKHIKDVGFKLTLAARQAGLEPNEVINTLNSAQEKAKEEGPAPAPAAPAPASHLLFPPGQIEEELGEKAGAVVSSLTAFQDDKGKVKFSLVLAGELLKTYGVVYDTFWSDYMVGEQVFDNKEKGRFIKACAAGGLDYPVGKQYISQALWLVEEEKDWLIQQIESLPVWDKQQRISSFFRDYCGAEDSLFNKQAGLYLWTSLIGRMLASKDKPCKADIVIILVGEQGTRKTTLTHTLCLDSRLWSSFNFDMNEDEIKKRIRSSCVVEVPELTGFSRKDMTNIKQFFGESVDQYRQLYQEQTTTTARRCVFVMTTNEPEFLRDSTGERRFAPVKVGRIDIEAVQRDLLQLYAEALSLYKSSGVLFKELEELQPDHNEQFKEENPIRDIILDWLRQHPGEDVRTVDIVTGALLESPSRVNLHKKNVAGAMRSLGYELVQRKRGGSVLRIWEKQEE